MTLAWWTGWSEQDLLAMPSSRFRQYLNQTPYLRAYLLQMLATGAMVPHMDERGRSNFDAEQRAAFDARPLRERVEAGWRILREKLGRRNKAKE